MKERLRKTHYISGLTIAFFVGMHLFNHVFSIVSADKHIEIMTTLRYIYRNIFVEIILLLAVAVQIYSGLIIFRTKRKIAQTFFDKIHVWSGLYLSVFFVIHLCAIFVGRFFLHLDTNFYFGVAGLNSFPTNLFFIPYYSLAIIFFFGHIAAIHNAKMQKNLFGFTPNQQSKLILTFGICLTLIIIYGLTNHFKGIQIPLEYNVLIGE